MLTEKMGDYRIERIDPDLNQVVLARDTLVEKDGKQLSAVTDYFIAENNKDITDAIASILSLAIAQVEAA